MTKPFDKQEITLRQQCITELNRLEIKYGSRIFKNACNRKLIMDRQRISTLREIKIAEDNLARLKAGKPLP